MLNQIEIAIRRCERGMCGYLASGYLVTVDGVYRHGVCVYVKGAK